jgi:hypothetical protein
MSRVNESFNRLAQAHRREIHLVSIRQGDSCRL